MPPWDGFNNSIIANRQKDTFVHGFLDVSGRAFIRNGNLVVGFDSSLNGNVSIGNDLIIGGRLSVRQYDTRNIINTTTTNYQLIVSEDLSLNGTLFASGNVELRGNVRMAPSFTSTSNFTPNTTSATSYTWTKDNIVWNASSSSEFSTAYSYKLFDSTLTTAWGSTNVSPNNYVNGSYNSSGTTTTSNINSISGITSLKGEWAQIRSSTPLILNSYQFTSGSTMPQMPKTYYILGSNDGSIWYGIQYGTMSAAPVSTTFTTISNVINASTTYSSSSYGSSTISTTTYGNNNNAYMYYRIIFTNLFTTTTNTVDIGEWMPTFTLQNDTLTLSSNKSTTNNMVLSVDGTLTTTGGYELNYSSLPTYNSNQIGYIFTPTITSTSIAHFGVVTTVTLPIGIWLLTFNLQTTAAVLANSFIYFDPKNQLRYPFTNTTVPSSVSSGSAVISQISSGEHRLAWYSAGGAGSTTTFNSADNFSFVQYTRIA